MKLQYIKNIIYKIAQTHWSTKLVVFGVGLHIFNMTLLDTTLEHYMNYKTQNLAQIYPEKEQAFFNLLNEEEKQAVEQVRGHYNTFVNNGYIPKNIQLRFLEANYRIDDFLIPSSKSGSYYEIYKKVFVFNDFKQTFFSSILSENIEKNTNNFYNFLAVHELFHAVSFSRKIHHKDFTLFGKLNKDSDEYLIHSLFKESFSDIATILYLQKNNLADEHFIDKLFIARYINKMDNIFSHNTAPAIYLLKDIIDKNLIDVKSMSFEDIVQVSLQISANYTYEAAGQFINQGTEIDASYIEFFEKTALKYQPIKNFTFYAPQVNNSTFLEVFETVPKSFKQFLYNDIIEAEKDRWDIQADKEEEAQDIIAINNKIQEHKFKRSLTQLYTKKDDTTPLKKYNF